MSYTIKIYRCQVCGSGKINGVGKIKSSDATKCKTCGIYTCTACKRANMCVVCSSLIPNPTVVSKVLKIDQSSVRTFKNSIFCMLVVNIILFSSTQNVIVGSVGVFFTILISILLYMPYLKAKKLTKPYREGVKQKLIMMRTKGHSHNQMGFVQNPQNQQNQNTFRLDSIDACPRCGFEKKIKDAKWCSQCRFKF
jgi:hypothetical protein